MLSKPAKSFGLLLQLKKEFVAILFCCVGKSFSPLAEKDCCQQQQNFVEVLQKQFQPKTRKCGKFGPFLRTDHKTEQLVWCRSGGKPFLPLAKKIFDFIFSPPAEKIFSF